MSETFEQTTKDLLNSLRQILDAHLAEIDRLLGDKYITAVSRRYEEYKNRKIDTGFNLFLLISDTYHRENFHSDIMKALLDPTEKHGNGTGYLNLFLNYLNTVAAGKLNINPENYNTAKVYRERGRIDILICDDKSKHAVIIENKINRAGDMHRQLPRYALGLKQEGYHIDAIVYLLLNYHIRPNTEGWAEADRQFVNPKLLVVPVNDDQPNDLVNGWLMNCVEHTEDNETLVIINQYLNLLKWLGKKAMDKQLMENFYKQMKQANHFATAMSLRSMVNELPLYRLERIIDRFRDSCHPFESVWNWQNKAAVFEAFRYKGGTYAIDIYPEQQSYRLQFFLRQSGQLTPDEVLSLIEEEKRFEPAGERLQRAFKFPSEEDELYDFLERFKSKLKVLVEKAEVQV